MRHSIAYILAAAAFAGLGVAEDRYEVLADYADFIWFPIIPFGAAFFLGCLSILDMVRFKPASSSLLPLVFAVAALGLVVNNVVLEMPETITIDGGFEGGLTDAQWESLNEQFRPVSIQAMFWDVYDYNYSRNAMGIKDIRITHETGPTAAKTAIWTSWHVSVTCKPRRIPKKFRRYAPIPLIVSYFGAKVQFTREWKKGVAEAKYEQAAHNFMMELLLCDFPKKSVVKAIECVSLYDDDGRMKAVFGQMYERQKDK